MRLHVEYHGGGPDVTLVPCRCAGALGATGRIASGIAATTHLLDDHPMGRRREPRHPLGAGERDDRDRLQKQIKEAKKEAAGKRVDSELDPIAIYGDGDSEYESEDADDEEEIDTCAEAGGMGLFLVPLTTQDMRANYPEEIAGTASAVGAVARAKVMERAAAGSSDNDSNGRQEEEDGEEKEQKEEEERKEGETADESDRSDTGSRGRVRRFIGRSRSPADGKPKKSRVRWRSKPREKSVPRDTSS